VNSAALVIDKPIMELLNITNETTFQLSTDGKNIILSPQNGKIQEQDILESLDESPPKSLFLLKMLNGQFCKSLCSKDLRILLLKKITRIRLFGRDSSKGLKIVCVKDNNHYELVTKVTDGELAKLNITRDTFHGDWNYCISPKV